jgi:membrane protein YqaA with SNARE-associated domain
MNLVEKYIFLFVDTFYGNFIFTTDYEWALVVMKDFGYLNHITWMIALLAVACVGMTNYLIGVIFYNIFIKYSLSDSVLRYQNIKNVWQKYYFLVLPFCFMPPFAKTLIVFCGFLRFKLLRSLLFLLIFKSLYYCCELYL